MSAMHPNTAWFTVNRRCDMRCKWCYAAGTNYNPKQEMGLQFSKELLDVAIAAGIRHIIIIGGEPTLWKPLTEFNSLCRNKKMRTVLVTNGKHFGNDTFWDDYQQNPSDNIGLSLKACNPQQLREVAGAGSFSELRQGIERAISLGAGVCMTYNTFYTDTLVEMVRFAVDCGAKSVKIDFCSTTFANNAPFGTYMVEPRTMVRNVLRDYPELSRITSGNIVFEMMVPFCLWPTDFINELKRKRQLLSVCHVHKRVGIIFDVDGKLMMCNALFDYPIGRWRQDYFDGESLLALLNSERVTNNYCRIGCYPAEECKSCRWYADCGGGCPLRWALYKPSDYIKPYISIVG